MKPGNVLLDEEGNAYLSDFGIAVMGDSLLQIEATTTPGKRAYVSPEQLRSERPTPRSDIYSLGVVVFEMLAGDHPCLPIIPGCLDRPWATPLRARGPP